MKEKLRYFQYIVGILILCIILFRIDLEYAIETLSKLNIPMLFGISLITIPQILLKSSRWRYLLHLQGIDYSMSRSFITYAKGIYLGIITPARTGELIKAVHLRDERNVQIGEGISSVLLDRFFDLYVLLFVSVFSCLKFSIRQPVVWGILMSILVFTPVMSAMVKSRKVRKIFKQFIDIFLPKEKDGFALRDEIDSFYQGLKKVYPMGILVALILTVIIYAIFFAQCYFLSKLVPINLSFVDIVFVSSLASLVALIPVSALGIGTREATVVYFFGKVGVTAANAIIYSFLLFFSFYIIGAIVGFLSWNIRFKKEDLEKL